VLEETGLDAGLVLVIDRCAPRVESFVYSLVKHLIGAKDPCP
jgi:hypothetical protein